jgi:FO synthase
MGGTLMNESITRAAGRGYGQEFSAKTMIKAVSEINRVPRQRTILYQTCDNCALSAR